MIIIVNASPGSRAPPTGLTDNVTALVTDTDAALTARGARRVQRRRPGFVHVIHRLETCPAFLHPARSSISLPRESRETCRATGTLATIGVNRLSFSLSLSLSVSLSRSQEENVRIPLAILLAVSLIIRDLKLDLVEWRLNRLKMRERSSDLWISDADQTTTTSKVEFCLFLSVSVRGLYAEIFVFFPHSNFISTRRNNLIPRNLTPCSRRARILSFYSFHIR